MRFVAEILMGKSKITSFSTCIIVLIISFFPLPATRLFWCWLWCGGRWGVPKFLAFIHNLYHVLNSCNCSLIFAASMQHTQIISSFNFKWSWEGLYWRFSALYYSGVNQDVSLNCSYKWWTVAAYPIKGLMQLSSS